MKRGQPHSNFPGIFAHGRCAKIYENTGRAHIFVRQRVGRATIGQAGWRHVQVERLFCAGFISGGVSCTSVPLRPLLQCEKSSRKKTVFTVTRQRSWSFVFFVERGSLFFCSAALRARMYFRACSTTPRGMVKVSCSLPRQMSPHRCAS